MQDNSHFDDLQINSANDSIIDNNSDNQDDFHPYSDEDILFNETIYIFSSGQYETAFETFNNLANNQYAPAMTFIGDMYRFSWYVYQDYKKAKEWYDKALSISPYYDKALLGLGCLYYYGEGVPKDLTKAFELFNKSADNNNRIGEYYVGLMYFDGSGVEQDYKKAIEYFFKSAQKGYLSAQNRIGYMYSEGLYVEQNYEQAVAWWEIAAKQGHPIAQHSLGYSYHEGNGVPKNPELATRWYRISAENGYARAQFNLGLNLIHENPTEEDKQEAFKWFTLSAEQGFVKGQLFLGYMYQRGFSVPVDYKKAKKLYKQAIAQGDTDAVKQLKYIDDLTRPKKEKRNNILGVIFIVVLLSTMFALGKRSDAKKAEEQMWQQTNERLQSKEFQEQIDKIYKETIQTDKDIKDEK